MFKTRVTRLLLLLPHFQTKGSRAENVLGDLYSQGHGQSFPLGVISKCPELALTVEGHRLYNSIGILGSLAETERKKA